LAKFQVSSGQGTGLGTKKVPPKRRDFVKSNLVGLN
jgi:hypothetical protein